MRPTTDLFDLIRSMSETERQLFVRSVQKKGSQEAVLVRLFDAIARMPEYDEAALIASQDHEPVRRGFASYKHHLYNMVLRFVTMQDADTPLAVLMTTIQSVEGLIDRGLYQQAWRLCKRAALDAQQIDAFDIQWRLLQQERNIVMIRQERHYSDETMADALARIDADIALIEACTQQVNALRRIQRLLTTLTKSAASDPNDSLTLALTKAFGKENPSSADCHSLTAAMLWHHVHILYYGKVNRAPDVVHVHASQLLEMLTRSPQIACAFSMHLMRAAATFATASTWIGDLDGVRKAVDILQKAPERFGFKRTAAMHTLALQSYTYQAVVRDEALDFENIDEFLRECLGALEEFAAFGRRLFADELRVYVAKMALVTQRYDVVQAVAHEVLRHKSPSPSATRTFMRQCTCIMALLGNDADAVDAIATSALRNAKADKLLPALASFFRTAQKYVYELDRTARRNLLQRHLETVQAALDTQNTHDALSDSTAPHVVWTLAVLADAPFIDTYCAAMRNASAREQAQ
jgi:hypothetical protein